jgi:hypothetical protein
MVQMHALIPKKRKEESDRERMARYEQFNLKVYFQGNQGQSTCKED